MRQASRSKRIMAASGTSGLQANNYFTGIVGWQTNYQLTANCDFFTRSGVAVADQRYSLISSAGTVNYDFLTPGLSSTVGLAHYFSPADGIPFAPSKIFVDYTYNYFGSYHTERRYQHEKIQRLRGL